jgi:hypothetical protein
MPGSGLFQVRVPGGPAARDRPGTRASDSLSDSRPRAPWRPILVTTTALQGAVSAGLTPGPESSESTFVPSQRDGPRLGVRVWFKATADIVTGSRHDDAAGRCPAIHC